MTDTENKNSTSNTETKPDRRQLWERSLLDLTLRNPLLNFRNTKRTLLIMGGNPAGLEDRLSSGVDLEVRPLPDVLKDRAAEKTVESLSSDENLFAAVDDDGSPKEETKKVPAIEQWMTPAEDTCTAADEALDGRSVLSFLTEKELEDCMKAIRRAAKTALEENGAGTLFIAAGFLKWYEDDKCEKERLAPLVLVPVEITKALKAGGFKLRSGNDETLINSTLLEFLRQMHGIDIKDLDPLPEDESGTDMQKICDIVSEAVSTKKGWQVENISALGLFSFGQFVMWNDLRSRGDELAENIAVKSLMDGKWLGESDVYEDPAVLDKKYRPSELCVPLSADSSQMAAIAAAADGASFVLHGPPGTGKSQTITNMIANALYHGKRVLFASEKMAALSVVQKRLEGIGIGDFCLEIHSNKAKKSEVLAKLGKALETKASGNKEELKTVSDELYKIREELNAVTDAVHMKRECGLSLYELIGEAQKYGKYKGRVNIGGMDISSVNADKLKIFTAAIKSYEESAAPLGDITSCPLKGIGNPEYSADLRDEKKQLWAELSESCKKALDSFHALSDSLGADLKDERSNIKLLDEMAELKADGVPSLYELAASPSYDTLMKGALKLTDDAKICKEKRQSLENIFAEQVFSGDALNNAGALLSEYKEAEGKWFLKKALDTGRIVKELKTASKAPSSITKENAKSYLEELTEYKERKAAVDAVPKELKDMLGGLWLSGLTDLTRLREALLKADRLHVISMQAGAAWDAYTKATGEDANAHAALKEAMSSIEAEIKGLRIIIPDEEKEPYLKNLSERFKVYSENTGILREYTGYLKAAEKLDEAGLVSVREAFENGNIKTGEGEASFLESFYRAVIDSAIKKEDVLSGFRAASYEGLIDRFEEYTEKYRSLAKSELKAKLSASLPTEKTDLSEITALKKAIASSGRRKTLRKLFGEIPHALVKTAPCMLMSPISVAQYIDPSFPPFDLVIFDEASQLPTAEAVGTIARGKNVIVVGDPKQLPPTSFFKASGNAEDIDDEFYEDEDLESLLDDCLAISMPSMYLKWHYRSRHESLITFSNRNYYGGKLSTFPSPDDIRSAVTLEAVDGVYDKGGGRTNKAEAEAVVAEVMERFAKEHSPSIGIVTFSAVQQKLIDDLLTKAFEAHPEYEEADRESEEPVFVKNLENVQGDERDIILFSVGYGPDKDGKVSMNFGPLNRDGGWRRLNVAVTRARKEMKIFAALKPSQIDETKTKAQGVKDLKAFLEYASRNEGSVSENSVCKNVLADQIAENIKSAETKVSIGSSDFRMDIGIVDKDDPGRYSRGIMLDGPSMLAAGTAADRFLIQPSVMKGLGWNTERIWSLEWYDDPEAAIENIDIQAVK